MDTSKHVKPVHNTKNRYLQETDTNLHNDVYHKTLYFGNDTGFEEKEALMKKKTEGCGNKSNVTECREVFDADLEKNDNSVAIEEDNRGLWGNKCEFFLAIMGYTVGLGSVWRFPYLCSRNGGGAFLIPFFLFMITSGGPLYYLEVCLGQFSGKSAGLAFEFCPLLKGIGLLQLILSVTVTWYYMLTMAWILYFLYNSFFPVLPWSTCDNKWNTNSCIGISELWTGTSVNTNYSISSTDMDNNVSIAPSYNMSSEFYNNSGHFFNTTATVLKQQSSAYEFWEYRVIRRSDGLDNMGNVQLHLLICLFLSWGLTVAAVIKGVKSLGKVVYVTATAPYIFITIMLIKGLTLDGALDGIITFLKPDFSKLLTAQVWLDAAIQVYFSLGPSWGGLITMSSYNPFHQKSFWPSIMCVMSAAFTSFYNGLVVYTLLGYMAASTGSSVQEVASQSGPGLVFVVFPTALSQMPLPQLWCVLFFIILVTVAFDSLFGLFETVTSAIVDFFPRQLISKRTLVSVSVGLAYFVFGIPLTMNGSIYLFQLADWYFSTFGLLVGSLFECIGLCWIYGTDRFAKDIEIMTGRKVCVMLRVMWGVFIPISLIIVFIVVLAQYTTPKYGYNYSAGTIATGSFIGILPITAVFLAAIVTLLRSKGHFMQRLKTSLKPSKEWIPHDRKAAEEYMEKPYTYPESWWGYIALNLRGTKDNPIF
ncbi:sodium- and chloride-dependent glycine transporter 1-like isoform X2 [Mercenaria mercenaria]|uniref:sodium- and chloride-dependent glycine transporter 1-like isoform X2 n=1 Tax=Mercenaria mercenaria TaxID=6596 RepID=UPI00234F007D|nr:sodium- and chloride-dependent glycine transporter 1-like isoform X2 [Mercenaria mercenaria]